MTEKKNSSPLPQDTYGLAARRFLYTTVAGACGSFLFKSPAGRWASLAFGAGLGVGSAYIECFGSSAKFANPKSSETTAFPDGED